MTYVRVPEGEDINNAELTGLLQAVQDESNPGGTLHIFTDSLTSLRQMRRRCGGEHAGWEYTSSGRM
eukprot:7435215-Pyramimonas_sp.AAC.1